MKATTLQKIRIRRAKRTRVKIAGGRERPRLAVFRSNRAIYAQLIDDDKAHTIISASSREIEKNDLAKSKIDQAKQVGVLLSKKAIAIGIKSAVFDRRGYRYHGRVRALAEGARGGGLKF